jgi:MoaA/NifB/PqqE/SkfB family radical SAM enzyme
MGNCAYPWQQMIIDLTGEVVPCCYWSGYGNFGKPLGNTNASSLDEIWHGEAYTELRERVASGEVQGHPCGNCLAYRSTGTFPGFTWPAGYVHESGHCYLGQIPESFAAAIADKGDPVMLCEDGKPLTMPNALHDDIRGVGLGRYSIWNGWFYFSSFDNADPIASGRRYELVCGEIRSAIDGLVADSQSGRNLKLAYSEYEAGKSRISAQPSMISLISTADCNIDCPGCSQNIVRVSKVQHRPETVPAVLAKVPYLAQLIWHGGEPFLIKKFRSFIDQFEPAQNPNLTFGFTSNGTMITEDEAAKLEKFPRINASVSIDSFDRETFERIRLGAKLDRVWGNFQLLLGKYNAPRRVFSVGMIVCKSNMVELASNIEFAIEHDIGLNLSPVVIYPVTEQLNVFSDFDLETQGWLEAVAKAKAMVANAKTHRRRAISRVDPEGMLDEIGRLIEAARLDCSDVVPVDCQIFDPHGSLARMRRPAVIAYGGSGPLAYLRLEPGMREGELRLPRRLLGAGAEVRLDVVHDVMEPDGFLITEVGPIRDRARLVQLRLPEFTAVARPRNIKWAHYGDSTPDGHHVQDPREIHWVYRQLYKHEVRAGARISFGHLPGTAPESSPAMRFPGQLLTRLLERVRSGGR